MFDLDKLVDAQTETTLVLYELLDNIKRSNKILMMVNIVNIFTIITIFTLFLF